MFKLSFRNQVMAGFGVSILLVLIVGILSYTSINKLEEDTVWVDHTQSVIKTSNSLLQSMVDAETGMRGFVASGNTVFLERYNKSLPRISSDLASLKTKVDDNPEQVRRVDSLGALVGLHLSALKANVEARESKGLEYVIANRMLLNGKSVMDRTRAISADLIDSESKLLVMRKNSTQQAATTAVIFIVVGSIIFLLIIVVLFYYIQGTFATQKRIEEEIKVANVELGNVLAENEAKNWLLTGTGQLNERMQGQQSEKELAENILAEVCSYTEAATGTIYLYNEKDTRLDLYSTYAFANLSGIKRVIPLGEGWIGEVARSGKATVVKGKLNDKIELQSSILLNQLASSYIVPFFFDKKLKGIIEIAFNHDVDDNDRDYLSIISNDIGIAINTAQARTIMHDLYEETQQQAEELSAQQEEMRVTNEELMNKTEMLEASEEELRVQQEELRTINAELEEKASLLEEKNQAIEEARAAINIKVEELETTGKYKSEFLANMSHELRTPLNSILVLARILKDNKPANLSEDQIKYASVIFNAGNDLLTLINDILDLSKIESGKLDMQNEDVQITEILSDMESLFAEVAANKKIRFTTNVKNVAPTVFTDKIRVEQVIKNLLSNAFKFTSENGAISINVDAGKSPQTVSFSIRDTGIGIPADKQKIIFEAFQQADGSTSRKYGGTGLGLSISRELASLLGGAITLQSKQGEGSEFTLTIPVQAKVVAPVEGSEVELPTVQNFAPAKDFLKPAPQNR
ncbi:MAG: CHASE3 domain-containing protein, partial [Bacteroidota bacterium]